MNKLRRLVYLCICVIALLTPSILPITGSVVIAEAASLKISYKSLTLEVGKTKTLKVSGTTKKITWTSNKKSVATVSSKGKVTAKAVGEAVITAEVSGKKLTCKVTVKEPVNPYLKDAPYNPIEFTIENINIVVPVDWNYNIEYPTEDSYSIIFAPTAATKNSYISFQVTKTDKKAPKYSEAKKEFSKTITEDAIKAALGKSYEVTDWKAEDFTTKVLNIYKTGYTAKSKEITMKQAIYSFYIDNYKIECKVSDAEELDLIKMAEYMLSSVILK
ncbi:MAG: Ig protein [Herbinix sp.]|jgi:hypothetical protein|nr:Ig protein [Herbinix sp.]